MMAWRRPIIWTNAGILLMGPLGTNSSEILIEISTFFFKKICLKVSSAKWRPFCIGLIVLMQDVFVTAPAPRVDTEHPLSEGLILRICVITRNISARIRIVAPHLMFEYRQLCFVVVFILWMHGLHLLDKSVNNLNCSIFVPCFTFDKIWDRMASCHKITWDSNQ